MSAKKKKAKKAPAKRGRKKKSAKSKARTLALRKARTQVKALSNRKAKADKKAAPKNIRSVFKAGPVTRKKRPLERLDEARLILKQEEGTDLLAQTPWLTPTKKGFATVRAHVADVIKAKRIKRTTIDVFTYSLNITFNGPDGKPINHSIEGANLKHYEWVKNKQSTERLINYASENVRLNVYGQIKQYFGAMSPPSVLASKMNITEKEAGKLLNDIRAGRDAKFKFTLFRTAVKPKR